MSGSGIDLFLFRADAVSARDQWQGGGEEEAGEGDGGLDRPEADQPGQRAAGNLANGIHLPGH